MDILFLEKEAYSLLSRDCFLQIKVITDLCVNNLSITFEYNYVENYLMENLNFSHFELFETIFRKFDALKVLLYSCFVRNWVIRKNDSLIVTSDDGRNVEMRVFAKKCRD